MEEEKRDVLIFFAVSVLIMVGYSYFFPNSMVSQPQQQVMSVANNTVNENSNTGNSQVDFKNGISEYIEKFWNARSSGKLEKVHLNSERLSGEILSKAVKINNIFLKGYVDDKGKRISLFGSDSDNYFALTDWISDDKNVFTPDADTNWDVSGTELSEESPITFSWDNQRGLLFEKKVSVDENFVITIENKVKNYGEQTVNLKLRSIIHREFLKNSEDAWTFYNGPLGYINGKLEEISYKDIVEENKIAHQTHGGWFGITDKYWLVAFIPNQNANCKILYKHSAAGEKNIYEIENFEDEISLAPSQEVVNVQHLFVGAKEIKTLDMYEDKLGVKHFDLAIDFGWLYILTKPLLYALAYIKDLVGNMGVGILLLTLLIKILLFPLANKSYRSMNRMKEIQPKIQEIQRKYANDKVRLGQEVSNLYKKEQVNPIGGCLPTLLQSPILFALYKVLYISIEMRQAPFIFWIHDLSLPDPMYILNLFGLIPIDLPGFLQIGILPILMGFTMYLQQKMGPAPADPSQASMMLIMPIMFTVMFAQLPSGLILYWTFSYVLAMGQQYLITKIDENRKQKEIEAKAKK